MASFTSCARILYNTTNVDRTMHTIVHCSDGKYVEVPKAVADKCPFIEKVKEEMIPEFEYPAAVLENLVCWTEHYGIDGFAESEIVRPCIYRNILHVLKNKWDNGFFVSRLTSELNIGHYLQTVNAAEKFNMKGLHCFLCVGLSCKFRSEDDAELIHKIMGLPSNVQPNQEDIENVTTRYPWLNEAIEPVVRK
ncbi:hypothetical protein C3747_65g12 [Trypanosoma cruzi]|uniref:Uncharacterized protein n=2 Tax=Trypanosoma cruzi TaxID=5693 RepID=Q4D1P4_TRYCC|nr:hypothetical protein, conserved [Trypanosoma cruzi]EAN86445.1 hypothetical protein, conserved [Trypanosoma cruzi]PWV10787.1 hypothetical protein C3747_65g12 [Trypanosoma cruzi]|eukprot:XP_808296.1 hypothetical protein [Trypanosoma cruzi strain CL Brener]